MPEPLVLLTVIDVRGGVLLVMVSGVALFGWQTTGLQPEAPLFLLALVLCFALPLAARLLRRRLGWGASAGLAALPADGCWWPQSSERTGVRMVRGPVLAAPGT